VQIVFSIGLEYLRGVPQTSTPLLQIVFSIGLEYLRGGSTDLYPLSANRLLNRPGIFEGGVPQTSTPLSANRLLNRPGIFEGGEGDLVPFLVSPCSSADYEGFRVVLIIQLCKDLCSQDTLQLLQALLILALNGSKSRSYPITPIIQLAF
jgi:hypothetical protein